MYNSDPSQAIKHVIKTEGARGLQKGLTFTLMRDMPGYCIYFYSYFYLKPACIELGLNDQLACFMSGGLAGSLLWTLGMPGDTMKSKWQTDTGKNLKIWSSNTFDSVKIRKNDPLKFF